MVSAKTKTNLRRAYQLMRARSGHQHWWPGETPFEVCVGAILTQNTAWTNVERAMANLKQARVLEPEKLFALPEVKLAESIHPAGYFNVKARRLRSFSRVLIGEFGGELGRLFAGETAVARAVAGHPWHWAGDGGQSVALRGWAQQFRDRCLHQKDFSTARLGAQFRVQGAGFKVNRQL